MSTPKKKDVQVGIRMQSELRDELRDLAIADNRSLAAYVVIVLEKHVAAKSKKPK